LRFFKFTKADRLLKRQEFLRLSGIGKKTVNSGFIIIAASGLTDRTRLGITVSKKVGCAAVRNRIKRSAREFYRLNRRHMKGCWDINLIAKKAAAAFPAKQIFSSLEDIFAKATRTSDY
jgi:ribonuclease P protein component